MTPLTMTLISRTMRGSSMLFLPYLLHCRCDVGLVWISGTALGVDLVKRLEETLFRCQGARRGRAGQRL